MIYLKEYLILLMQNTKTKPEPKAFDLMVKKFGINPKDTIYVEDIVKIYLLEKKRMLNCLVKK